jgi:hypothetical protein
MTDEQKARLLDALECDGVDNWEGYNISGGYFERTLQEIEAEERRAEMLRTIEPLIDIIESNMEIDFPAGRDAGSRARLTEDGQSELVNFLSEHYKSIT